MIIFQLIQRQQFRGAEMFASQLATHLDNLGHTNYIISLFPGDNNLPFKGNVIKLNRPNSKRLFDYKGWKALALLIEKYQPDVIQCNAGDTLKYAVISKFFFRWKQPIVFRNASMVGLYINNPFTKFINRQLYKKVNCIVSVSINAKTDLIKVFPELKQKTTVIPIGIEVQTTKEIGGWEGKESKVNIIHVGGFSFEKNHEGLLSIFKLFLKKNSNSHLHLFGEGPKKKVIEQKATELKISDKITFYGWVPNPVDYISKADLLVLPSIIEGLPGVILEAMSVKTIVVAYNVGGISEVIQPDVTGFLVAQGDELSFVENMQKALLSDNNNLKINAYNMVNDKYKNSNIAKKFAVLYSELIS